MNKLILAGAALAAIPTAATAQTVHTDCYSRKHSVHCRSTVTPSLSDTLEPIIKARRAREYQEVIAEGNRLLAEQRRLNPPEAPRNHSPEFQRYRVGDFIGRGDCPGAQRYAAESDNPALVKRVEEFCGKAEQPSNSEQVKAAM